MCVDISAETDEDVSPFSRGLDCVLNAGGLFCTVCLEGEYIIWFLFILFYFIFN